MILDLAISSGRGPLPVNEDMVLAGDELLRDQFVSRRFELDAGGKFMVAVADGLGGGGAGDLASATALGRLRDVVQRMPADLDPDEARMVISDWAAETHAALRALALEAPGREGMGTTVVGLLFCNGHVYRFHAGDSRLYRYRQASLERLTADHSLRNETGDARVASNLLTNCLGGADTSWLEFAELAEGVAQHDRYLLCSDGLHDCVSDAVIGAVLPAEREVAASTLARAPLTAGGHDNCSILLLDVSGLAAQEP